MGVGFKHSPDYGKDNLHSNSRPVPSYEGKSIDVSKWIKAITAIIGTLVVLGGVVWGSAKAVSSMASQEDLTKVRDRVELVEKNDLVQTIILEQIRDSLDKIEKKLDTILSKE